MPAAGTDAGMNISVTENTCRYIHYSVTSRHEVEPLRHKMHLNTPCLLAEFTSFRNVKVHISVERIIKI